MHRFLCFLFPLFVYGALAQTSDKYNSVYADFYRAEDLYQKAQYSAARAEFRNFVESFNVPNDPMVLKAKFYEGLSALELYQNDGVDLLLAFNQAYPESIYRTKIYWKLAQYYYQKKKYESTIEWLDQLSKSDIPEEDMDEYLFKRGYAHFSLNEMRKARNAFFEVKDSQSQYGLPSLYYFSHIEYTLGAYQTALDGFEILSKDKRFNRVAPYYVAQIYYLQGRYEDVTAYAPTIQDSIPKTYEKDLQLIIGDAYFKLGDYDLAIPYLAKYNQRSKTTPAMDYQLGYAYYKTQAYEAAIPLLARATKQNDTLAQKAFYQIGESYLSLENYSVARSAFEQAYDIGLLPDVTEDALYQYAVLSYKLDLNPYNEAVVSLEKYLEVYPNSSRKDDVYQYLVNVYATTNQYEKALASLDRLPTKDYRLKSIYQLIAYNAGVEQFLKKNYPEAQRYFALVPKYSIDPEMTSKAQFWNADADFQQRKFGPAVLKYRQVLSVPGATRETKAEAYYNIGYAYLELGDTLMAIENFGLYAQQAPRNKHKLADAWMRVADGHYSVKENEKALNAYQKVLDLKAGFEDQALFYKGKTLLFQNRIPEKIAAHEEILQKHPSSKYVQLSVLEIANSYKSQGKYDRALTYYTRYTAEYPNSADVFNAELQIADIYFKKKDLVLAESMYKEIMGKNDDRNICLQAGKGLLAVYTEQRKPEKISEMNRQYPCAQVDSDEEEDVFYATAFEVYEDSNFREAIPQLQKYIDRYPEGKYTNELMFFMANCFYQLEDKPEAMNVYRQFLERPNNGYTEFAAIRLSKYLYNNGEYGDAYLYYKKIEEVASDPEVVFNARLGVMRTAFLEENWSQANVYASKLLAGYNLESGIELEAHYAKGMSNFNLNDLNQAKASLEWIVKNTTTIRGAEAKYKLAELYFNEMDFEQSEQTVRELLKRKPAYNFWVAKGLILQAKMAIAKEDYFQAEQTLKSVIDHYPIPDDGILMSANEVWDELMQIKDQPKEVEEDEAPIIELNEEGELR